MKQISEGITEIQEMRNNDTESMERFRRFDEASKKYQRLVERGLTKPRGYNLMTIDEIPRRSKFYI
jgi:hypothetical protein